ncbi:uncharacterized protein LOC143594704 [Bidens hawaiensis]|uniref:uncharacterized protein LOC143594704 n=1 Tax=Bidens hawaiensis TaxID=980011 RepID=UPI00404B6F9D
MLSSSPSKYGTEKCASITATTTTSEVKDAQMVSSSPSKYGPGKCASITATTATSEVKDAQMVSSSPSKYGPGKCASITAATATSEVKDAQMVNSSPSKYGPGKCASIITTATTTTFEVKDVQNDNKLPISFEEDQPKSPTAGSTSGNVNRNLVYARRKFDAELTNSDKNRTISSAFHQQPEGDKKKPDDLFATDTVRNFENEQTMEQWKARFSQLNNYLNQCDTSSQEVYLQKLRSFSPDECNRHAVELERRAMQLTMQEGTEMQRVKELNVLLQFGH